MASPNFHQYDDIIHLPHHVSSTRLGMSMRERAAQFSPFAALTGYDAAIQETGRLTDQRVELAEDGSAELDRKQKRLLENLDRHPEVSVTYFVPDGRKSGGAYVTETGRVEAIDSYRRRIHLSGGTWISFDEIRDLKGNIFHEAE